MANKEECILTEEGAARMLQDVLITENIIDPVFVITNGCAKGDCYFSYVIKVDAKGKNKTLSVFIKLAPTLPEIREVVPSLVFFRNEITFYKNLYPAFVTFRKDRKIRDPFVVTPKCYKTVDTECNESLVLENMLERGFKVFGRSRQMNDSHVILVLKEYAKLHAVSFAMKEQENDRFVELIENFPDYFAVSFLFQELFLEGCEMLKAVVDPIAEVNVYRAVVNYKEGLISFLKSLKNNRGNYGVVTHGDCWSNNMLFKCRNNNQDEPSELCFIDFQLSQVSSPVLDLAYFFYVTASPDMLKNLNHYLMIYHESLRKELSAMGSDVEKLYPFSALEEEWKKFAKYGIMMGVIAIRIMFRADEETLVFEDGLGSNTGVVDTFMKASKHDHIINEKYRFLVLHFYENGLF